MGKSERVRRADELAVARLVGECHELGDDADAWQRHANDVLARMTGSQLVITGEMGYLGNRPAPAAPFVETGWPSEKERGVFVEWLSRADLPQNPALDRFYALPGAAATLTRAALVRQRAWELTPFRNEVLVAMRLDEGAVSRRPVGGGRWHNVCLIRASGGRAFGDRERGVLALCHDRLAVHLGRRLLLPTQPNTHGLAPRFREVLACLLDGDSEKQAAARLGLRPATVHEYVKKVYRHFGVGSRAELLATFLRRYRGRPPA